MRQDVRAIPTAQIGRNGKVVTGEVGAKTYSGDEIIALPRPQPWP